MIGNYCVSMTNLFLFIVDRRSTFHHLTSWLTDARNLTNPNTVIMLVGNKKDLESQIDVSYEEAAQFAEENGLLFVEASAKTGQNVEEAFLRTAQLISQNFKDGYVSPYFSYHFCHSFTSNDPD